MTTQMEIRDDISIPQIVHTGRTSKYRLDELEKGEVLVVPIPEDKDPAKFSRNLSQVKAAAQRRTGYKYTMRRLYAEKHPKVDADSIGIWRVE